ncbi:predicted protein [Histoplasma capsulatum G186AR]|uniref:Uncharacterized protein n=1 Tax=Ajellomyces capsulatus (strain G186AR / H82 / ATCC MYA-2454 / RMSCC 2432) TaxID=447093 RepID=C0NQN3_AJECG|nr:uncharacterized protein HCBG_05313 [Histoplasma capsulatum G186AR]EEH05997.1 predicted protein [Histoplasma capsulatum G186AR]
MATGLHGCSNAWRSHNTIMTGPVSLRLLYSYRQAKRNKVGETTTLSILGTSDFETISKQHRATFPCSQLNPWSFAVFSFDLMPRPSMVVIQLRTLSLAEAHDSHHGDLIWRNPAPPREQSVMVSLDRLNKFSSDHQFDLFPTLWGSFALSSSLFNSLWAKAWNKSRCPTLEKPPIIQIVMAEVIGAWHVIWQRSFIRHLKYESSGACETGLTFVAHHILAHELYQESSIRYVVLLCVVFLAPSTVQYMRRWDEATNE